MFHAMMPECPDHVCLDDQLLAVHWGFVAPQYFHEKVRHHPVLWLGTPVPGFPTTPNYEYPHWQVKLACLSDYHDACHWSWIIALAGTVCFECGDREEGERIFQALWEARQREGGISELYEVTPEAQLVQLNRFSYLAEKPWTWGLAYTLRLAVQRHA